ncbi:hypothetical protein [Brachybacterium sp. Marseille-Q7125]|uniref:hypothetical protein n=1 Tax=Brachybacterium sp. Marseille-Q7125 TaxID=2932815 RepID=UPI001FF6B4D4
MSSPSPAAAPSAPAPRRTRRGAVLVGPSLAARYRPLVLMGLPLLAILLSPFAATALQAWHRRRVRAGHDGLVEQILGLATVQLVLGALLLWGLFALWALVPLVLTRTVVLFDADAGTLRLRKGLRITDRATLADVDHAVGEAERGGMALIGLRGPERHWTIPEVGWDAASFDGLRALQAAAGFTPVPPREQILVEHRRTRGEARNRELAARVGMPWREEYAQDDAAFRTEFDRIRRVLGGIEQPREGDPTP